VRQDWDVAVSWVGFRDIGPRDLLPDIIQHCGSSHNGCTALFMLYTSKLQCSGSATFWCRSLIRIRFITLMRIRVRLSLWSWSYACESATTGSRPSTAPFWASKTPEIRFLLRLPEMIRINKLQFLIQKKIYKKFSAVFLSNFWSSKPWIRICIHLKCWIRIQII
jgi:hypothetical protein